VLGIEPRASYMINLCSITELYPHKTTFNIHLKSSFLGGRLASGALRILGNWYTTELRPSSEIFISSRILCKFCFVFFAVLGHELSLMITRQVLYHLSNSSSPVFVKIRSCELFAWAGFKSPSSQVAGITGMCHHAWPLYFLLDSVSGHYQYWR
jgi:hypothetical protein